MSPFKTKVLDSTALRHFVFLLLSFSIGIHSLQKSPLLQFIPIMKLERGYKHWKKWPTPVLTEWCLSPSLKSHLSSGIPFIGLWGGVSDQGGGPRTAVMRRWRRSLGLIIAVNTWHTQRSWDTWIKAQSLKEQGDSGTYSTVLQNSSTMITVYKWNVCRVTNREQHPFLKWKKNI